MRVELPLHRAPGVAAKTLWPYVRVRIGDDRSNTELHGAVVDTGATVTLASLKLATDDLEWTEERVHTGLKQKITSLGRESVAYGHQLEIELVRESGVVAMTVSATWVYFTSEALPGGLSVLLGQRSFLGDSVFVQMQGPARKPGFSLRHLGGR